MTDTYSAEGTFKTVNGAKYLQQVCKHWAHNLAVTFDDERGEIIFPRNGRGGDWPGDAKVTLEVVEEGLSCHISASAQGQLEGLKGAVTRHVDRFAFREAPLEISWFIVP